MSYNSPFTGNVVQPTDVSFRSITLTANTQLEWPINGNATDDYSARIMQVTASSGGLELRMPPANQSSVGNDALIRNVGANTFTVKDFNGVNTIISVAAGESKYIYITTNPNEQGTWGIIAFGVGASAADAATLAGYGLLAQSTTLNQSHPVTTFSTSATADATYRAQMYAWTGGAGTLTISSSATLGNNWFTMLRNAGTGNLSLAPSGGDQINGSASLDLAPGDSCFLCCSGTAFFTVGLGRSTEFNFTQLTKAVVSGTVTLTSAEASNVIQKYTGLLSGNVTIEIPKVIQVYYITNQTTDGGAGYALTFTTGVAGAAVAVVPAGQQVILLCDSVNVYNASTVAAGASTLALSNGSASNPSLSFAAQANTGIYRPASNELGITVNGVLALLATTTGIQMPGGVSGGTF
jgi:hypothetical protein